MGRGRAKAKQTKVARQLKYNSGGTDLESLRREILGEDAEDDEKPDEPDEYDDLYARYADMAEDDGDDEDDRDR
jgi:hypothetical protein